MKERETINGVLIELGRRLWIARAIREAAFAGCLTLFCLICFQLIGPALDAAVPAVAGAVRFILPASLAVVVAEAFWHSLRAVTARQAAARADERAHLKDELKSAHWFLSQRAVTSFVDFQLTRAAGTAAGLDLAGIAPRSLPGNTWFAAALGLLLVALNWMTPQLSRSWDMDGNSAAGESVESSDLRSLLKDAPQDAQVTKLDLALRTLQQASASPEQKRQALAEARDAIDQANMDASAARETMARLAESLQGDPRFDSAVQAMKEGRSAEALAQLRQLQGDDGAAQSDTAASEKSGAPEEIRADVQDSAAADAAGKRAVVNQDAMNRVVRALEQANERIEAQARVNSVKRRMDNSLLATSQRSQLTASRFDNRSTTPNATPAPETGVADLRGGTLFRQAAVARDEDDAAREGSQTGDASGDSAALPLDGVATRRLDAQLKLEAIAQKSDPGEQPDGNGDGGWFYSASRAQKSMLTARDVRSSTGHDREAAASHDRVTVRQRTVVKNYFLNLHESEKK